MPISIDTKSIRAFTPAEVAQHLRKVRTRSPDEHITHDLLEAVECGSILPSTFAVWLGVSRSPTVIREAWKQKFSVQIRQAGIKRFSKLFRSQQWDHTWESLGGTEGLLDLFSDFSVHEIQNVCLVISASTKGIEVETKREKVTELLKALLPRLFPETPHRNSDSRPLFKLYQRLVPGCTSEFVTHVLEHTQKGNWTHFHNHYLFRSHPQVLRDMTLRTIFKDRAPGRQWLLSLTGKHPSAQGTYPRFSASMQFSLEVLRRLVKEESSTFSDVDFLDDLVDPLVKRAIRRKIDWSYTQEIVDLTVQYLNYHPLAAKGLDMHWGRLLRVVAVCWSRRPDLFETSFYVLLRIWYKAQQGRRVELSDFEDLLYSVAISRRYALLRFCYKVTTERDIDNEGDLISAEGPLGPRMLEKLPAEDALGLFTRLRHAKGDKNLIDHGPRTSSITGTYPTPDERGGCPDLFETILIHRVRDQERSKGSIQRAEQLQSKAEGIAGRNIEERKKRAMSSSDQAQRAYYAASVLCFAIAIRSMRLYKEAQVWARRFIRDPLTARALHCYYPDETRVLLSGIPIKLTKLDKPSDIRTRIEEANQILLDLFETLCLALREPSYATHSWASALRLFKQVIEERMKRSPTLKTALDLSDDQVYDIVWETTLSTFIKLEEEALKPGLERLELNNVRGILSYASGTTDELKAEPSTYRFLDNFAKARDQLWCKFRPTVYPAAATLPDPFPRGLPIQHLAGPYLISNPGLEAHAPYLAARANAAVYPHPTAASMPVPKDKDIWDAIGEFVDEYRYALQMLVPETLEQEAKEHVGKAYTYAIGPLSERRMSLAESKRYWQISTTHKMIQKFWPDNHDKKLASGEWSAVLPQVKNATEVDEWNPVPPQKEKIKARSLETTYIDLSMAVQTTTGIPDVHSKLGQGDPEIPGQDFSQDAIWSGWRPASEAEILAALIYLDSKNSAKSRILASPFPSAEDVRYPSVYLDEHFLSSNTDIGDRRRAIDYLKNKARLVPPTLVAQVARSTMDTLEMADSGLSDFANLERDAFLLIDILSKSDRPGLASQLIVRTILQRPGASSWHRQLLCHSFLRRIAASDAQACFEEFAKGILAKLEEQARAKDAAKTNVEQAEKSIEEVKPKDDSPKQPFVKVTTVKFLAQLLQNSEFVSEDFSFSVLSTLAQKASHADIRKAVVSSLVGMLRDSPAERAEKILSVLETMVPVAGNLNERQPVMDQDWKTAEETLDLPEIAADFSDDMMPMLSALFSFYPEGHTNIEHGEAYMTRIMVPIIERLKKETAQWTSLFLRKHGINAEVQKELKVPLVPKSLSKWGNFLNLKSPYLPLSYLEEYVDYTIFNIATPGPIKVLNHRLSNDAHLRTDPSVKYWHSLFSTGCDVTPKFPLTTLLESNSTLPEDVGLTTKKIQELFLKQFTALLWNDAPHYYYLNATIQRNLRPTRFDEAWVTGKQPIVEAAVMYTDTLRTREWERDANRQPSVLPDTFPLRLWLLKYPQSDITALETSPLDKEQEEKCKAFADQLSKTVDQICGRIYHTKFKQLEDSIKAYTSGTYRWVIACYLGNIEKTRLSWLTRPDELRVELAAWLLGESVGPGDDEGKKRVDGMLLSWKKSESEEVRRWGLVAKCR